MGSLMDSINKYTQSKREGFKTKEAKLKFNIEVEGNEIPKGTMGHLMWKNEDGTYQFESNDISFPVNDDEVIIL